MFSITLIVFVLLDLIWIVGVAKKLYAKELKGMMRSRLNGFAAALFYLVYVIGLMYFVIMPMAGSGDGVLAFLRGAGFGLVAYGTYSLTNLVVLANWPIRLAVLDILWGCFATGLTAFIVVQIL